jgi:hypothetical protein
MADLSALLSRIEAATGPDRALTRDLCLAFIKHDDYPTIATLIDGALGPIEICQIGAAIALVEWMLPEWKWAAIKTAKGIFDIEIDPHFVGSGPTFRARSCTPALALLAALLRALIAKGEEESARRGAVR